MASVASGLLIALHMLLASAADTWDYRDFTLVDHVTGKSQHSDMFLPSIHYIVYSYEISLHPKPYFLQGLIVR